VVILRPDQEPTPEQIVQAVNGQLQLLQQGQRIGVILPVRYRSLFISAVNQEYLKHFKADIRVVEAFSWWCDGKGIPCVRYEVEPDCLDMLAADDSIAKDDPYVRMHFSVTTADRFFTKAGLVAVVNFLLDHLWDITLSPWEVSAGVLPFSSARQLMENVFAIYHAPGMTTTDDESPRLSCRETIH
jgi:hypothetical protein